MFWKVGVSYYNHNYNCDIFYVNHTNNYDYDFNYNNYTFNYNNYTFNNSTSPSIWRGRTQFQL